MGTQVKITLDEKIKDIPIFQKIKTFMVDKDEIFKYGVFMQEIPKHIKDSDFDYLQSKIPAMAAWYGDYIQCADNNIVNLSEDDRNKKNVSEAIGVALGLKYATELLNVNPNLFEKIPPPTTGKYLDYSATVGGKKYQIETKGTVGKNSTVNAMKTDIEQKKEDTKNDKCYLKFGVISKISSNNNQRDAECFIVDDPPMEGNKDHRPVIEAQLKHYFDLFSFILDNRNYNRGIKLLSKGKIHKIKIRDNRFFANYTFKGQDYWGECFDSRLIRENILNGEVLANGKVKKYFIGLDSEIVSAINKKDYPFIESYRSDKIIENSNLIQRFLDTDGVLIIAAHKGADNQLEQIFTEDIVKKRLLFYKSWIKRKPHKCGEPCRSKDKEGKPCEIMTYRSACSFHR